MFDGVLTKPVAEGGRCEQIRGGVDLVIHTHQSCELLSVRFAASGRFFHQHMLAVLQCCLRVVIVEGVKHPNVADVHLRILGHLFVASNPIRNPCDRCTNEKALHRSVNAAIRCRLGVFVSPVR